MQGENDMMRQEEINQDNVNQEEVHAQEKAEEAAAPVAIGEKIAYLRRLEGMTQAQLAEKLNISAQAVSKWESGGSHS